MAISNKILGWGIIGVVVLPFVLAVTPWMYSLTLSLMGYYPGNGSLHAEAVAQIAYEQEDPEICSKIRTVFEVMGPSTDELVRGCYSGVAFLQGEHSACLHINDSYSQNLCIENIAIKKTDLTICNSIKDDKRRNICQEKIKEK